MPRLLALLALAACGSDDPDGQGGRGGGGATTPILEDNIEQAVGDCLGAYRPPDAYPNQLVQGADLQRYTLKDPDAVCNDGSPAVMYVRAATDPAFEDIWNLHLQGGASCYGYASCVVRWCGLDYYDSSKMSSDGLPLEIAGFGVFDTDARNVLAKANHVWFYYCSSDDWRGQGVGTYDPSEIEEEDIPVELPPDLPAFSMYRRGHRILEAGLDELAGGLVADGGETLPPLDDADLVLFSGTSAGSVGARHQADWVRERLEPKGATVYAIFDAAVAPPYEDWPAPYDAAKREQVETLAAAVREAEEPDPFRDESCVAHLGAGADRCLDVDYVHANHITTPFIVRHDLQDLTGPAESAGIPVDDHEAMLAEHLAALADLPATAVEGEAIDVVPGAYGPSCGQHVGIEMTDWWRVGTVDGGGATWTMQDAVVTWYEGGEVSVVDAPRTGDGDGLGSDCPAVDDAH